MNFEPRYEMSVAFRTFTPLTRASIRISLFSNGVRSIVALHVQLLFVSLSGTSTVRMFPSIDAYRQSDQLRFWTMTSAEDAADRKKTNAIFFIFRVSVERLLSYRAVSYHILIPSRSTAILISILTLYLDSVSIHTKPR